ncbi:MAG TPA: pilus assembly protein TadG-related protein [Hyphomicrobium sp.]|nr:pilus assembly protein TadG-related protein [Hyphomicrobium sp.]
MLKIKPWNIKTFASDERGAVAMIFSLMMTALFFLAGIAIDYNRATSARSRISDAADAAALAAGRALMDGKMTSSEIEQMTLNYFQENVKSVEGQARIDTPTIVVDPSTGGVSINVNGHVNMTLARLGGFSSLDVPVSTTVNFQEKEIEVGMALDITGSMGDTDSNGQRKIDGLKAAFAKFADKLLPETSSYVRKVRIAVAPYSYSVNLGDYALGVSDSTASSCVAERKDGQYSDNSGLFFGAKKTACPSSKIMPLTSDHDTLVSAVDAFKANGSTAGHLGVQWAWNLISPNWAGAWGGDSAPVGYDLVQANKALKAVVLMTDGEFNTQYHGPQSAEQAKRLCSAMKDEGVVVFSVGFGIGGNAQALDTLKTCASEGPEYFANAANAQELDAAFARFADKLTALRVSR